jgi:predicted nucleic acid-binding Zn finger protein
MSAAAKIGYNYIDHGNGAYTILTPDHNQYEIDLAMPSCSCPDFTFRGEQIGECKHIRFIKGCIERGALSGVDALSIEERAAYDSILAMGCTLEEVSPGRWVARVPGAITKTRGKGSPSAELPALVEMLGQRLMGWR